MPPEFAQIHTCVLSDPSINGLSPDSGWNWVRMVVLAKRNRDRGRIGTPTETAYVLHTTTESIAQTVADLDGRIEDRDGQLYIRDYRDWQTLTNAERQADFKDAHRDDQTAPVTDGNGESHPVTGGNGQNDKGKVREEKVTEQQPHGAVAPRWEPVTAWAVAHFGEPATLKADGTLKAWVSNVCRALGPTTSNDPDAAARLLDGFFTAADRDGSWRFVTTANITERVGKWLAERRPTTPRPGGFNLCPGYDPMAPVESPVAR